MNSSWTHASPTICRFVFMYPSRYGYTSKNLHETHNATIWSPCNHVGLSFLWEFLVDLFSSKFSSVDPSSPCAVGLACSPLYDWISCNTWETFNPWPYGRYYHTENILCDQGIEEYFDVFCWSDLYSFHVAWNQ